MKCEECGLFGYEHNSCMRKACCAEYMKKYFMSVKLRGLKS